MLLPENILYAKRRVLNCPHAVQIIVDNIGGVDLLGGWRVLKCLTCGDTFKDYGENKIGDVINMDLKIYHRFIHPLLLRGVLKIIGRDEIIKEKVYNNLKSKTNTKRC